MSSERSLSEGCVSRVESRLPRAVFPSDAPGSVCSGSRKDLAAELSKAFLAEAVKKQGSVRDWRGDPLGKICVYNGAENSI